MVAEIVTCCQKRAYYDWAHKLGLDLSTGTDPCAIMPGAKSIIVLLGHYFQHRFAPEMKNHFGRCYLDDDRLIETFYECVKA